MDFKVLKEELLRILNNNPRFSHIATTSREALVDAVIEPMEKRYDKDRKDWEKTRKRLEERIEQLKEAKSVVPSLE